MEERPGHRDFPAFPRVKDFQVDTRNYFEHSFNHHSTWKTFMSNISGGLQDFASHFSTWKILRNSHDFRPFTCAKDFQATKRK